MDYVTETVPTRSLPSVEYFEVEFGQMVNTFVKNSQQIHGPLIRPMNTYLNSYHNFLAESRKSTHSVDGHFEKLL